jgi:hypothetical protein
VRNPKPYINLTILFVGLLLAAISFLISWQHGWHWFGRSGALVVLSAAIVEYRIFQWFPRRINAAIVAGKITKLPVPVSILKADRVASKIAHVMIILGTLIWAYGDLLERVLPSS